VRINTIITKCLLNSLYRIEIIYYAESYYRPLKPGIDGPSNGPNLHPTFSAPESRKALRTLVSNYRGTVAAIAPGEDVPARKKSARGAASSTATDEAARKTASPESSVDLLLLPLMILMIYAVHVTDATEIWGYLG
jgi:hypothetical protein